MHKLTGRLTPPSSHLMPQRLQDTGCGGLARTRALAGLAGLTLAALFILLLLGETGARNSRNWETGGSTRALVPCEWREHGPNESNLDSDAGRRHLTHDALTAENTAIHHADRSIGVRSGNFVSYAAYRAGRDACISDLFEKIAATHQVSTERVRAALVQRSLLADGAVFLVFGLLYAGVCYAVAGWLRRRVPADQRLAVWLTVVIFSALAATAGVMLGEIGVVLVESTRLDTQHLSYRIERIPWAQHHGSVWGAGVALFWLVSMLRFQRPERAAAPRKSVLELG